MHGGHASSASGAIAPAPDAGTGDGLEELLAFIRARRGFDWTQYRRPTLRRRISRRMLDVRQETFDSYRQYLEDEPAEFEALFNTILINVTAFFRDPAAWECVADEVLPTLLADESRRPLRVWSAGCASGEEPYTAAMVIAELLGGRPPADAIRIFATDIDDEALAAGRRGIYTAQQLAPVPGRLRDRYFVPSDGRFRICRDLRGLVVFGHNDLLSDPPLSRIDLVVCRNTLIYFEPSADERVLGKFAYALGGRGFLFLGKAESAPRQLFTALDRRQRVFGSAVRVSAGGGRSPLRRLTPSFRSGSS